MKRNRKSSELIQALNKSWDLNANYRSARRWMVIFTVVAILLQIICALLYRHEREAEWVYMHKDGYSLHGTRAMSTYVDLSYQGKQFSHKVDSAFIMKHKYLDAVRVKYLAGSDYVELYDGEEANTWSLVTVGSLFVLIPCLIWVIRSRRAMRRRLSQ